MNILDIKVGEEEYRLIKKCRNKVEQCKFTGEQAKKILQILEE